jgi:hypothetical protein
MKLPSQGFRDHQAKAEALALPSQRLVLSGEWFEQVGEEFRRDTTAGVDDADDDVARFGAHACRNLDAALIGEFDGVEKYARNQLGEIPLID